MRTAKVVEPVQLRARLSAASQPQRGGFGSVQVEWLDGFERMTLFAVDRFLRKSEFEDLIPRTYLVIPIGSNLGQGDDVEL